MLFQLVITLCRRKDSILIDDYHTECNKIVKHLPADTPPEMNLIQSINFPYRPRAAIFDLFNLDQSGMYLISLLCLTYVISTTLATSPPPLPKLVDKGKGIIIDEEPAESSTCHDHRRQHEDSPPCARDPVTVAVAGSTFGPLPSLLGRGMVPDVNRLATYNPLYHSRWTAGAYHGRLPGMIGFGGQADAPFDIARWVESVRQDRTLHHFKIPFTVPAINLRGYFKALYDHRLPGQFAMFAQIEVLDFLTEIRNRLGWIVDYAAIAFTVCRLTDLEAGIVQPFVASSGKWYGFYEWSSGQAPTKAPFRVQNFRYDGATNHWNYHLWGRPDLVIVYFVRFRIHHFESRRRIGP